MTFHSLHSAVLAAASTTAVWFWSEVQRRTLLFFFQITYGNRLDIYGDVCMWKQQAPFCLQGEYLVVKMRWRYGKAIAWVFFSSFKSIRSTNQNSWKTSGTYNITCLSCTGRSNKEQGKKASSEQQDERICPSKKRTLFPGGLILRASLHWN